MERYGLRILSGVHSGALIDLDAREAWTIGAGEGVDILLADIGVADVHCILERKVEGSGIWFAALVGGVSVFGIELKEDAPVRIEAGTFIAVGHVEMELLQLEETLSDDGHAAAKPLTPRTVAAARRAVLWQIDRRAYWRAWLTNLKGWRILPVALVGVIFAGWGVLHVLRKSSAFPGSRQQTMEYVRQVFPDVRATFNDVTGITTYAGYVHDRSDLAHLRMLALAVDQGRSVIQVIPMDSLVFNASLILERYYREVDISVGGAGRLVVKLPTESAMKDLLAWDFEAMGKLVKRELPELRDIDFSLESSDRKRVVIPWGSLDYSVLTTPEEAHFIVSTDGRRLFQGAVVKEGALKSIAPCRVELEAGNSSTRFELSRDMPTLCRSTPSP